MENPPPWMPTRVQAQPIARFLRCEAMPRHRNAFRALLGSREHPAFTNRALLPEFGPAPRFARFLVRSASAQLLGQATPLQQFLEATQGHPNRLTVMDTHPQGHAHSF